MALEEILFLGFMAFIMSCLFSLLVFLIEMLFPKFGRWLDRTKKFVTTHLF